MGDLSGEPSMEEILSSIKRIIAEEGDQPGRPRRPARGAPAAPAVADEVLELSDPIPATPAAAELSRRAEQTRAAIENGRAASPAAFPPPQPLAAAPSPTPASPDRFDDRPPQTAPAAAIPMPQTPVAPMPAPPPATPQEPVPETPPEAPIVSSRTADASRGALDSLSRLIVRPDAPAGDNTLEAMVREMLRPMLRDWLDTNLPPMVETMVAREIARITGGR